MFITPHAPSLNCPIDKTLIITSIELNEAVATCPPERLDLLPPGAQGVVIDIDAGSKSPRPWLADDETLGPKWIPSIPTRKIAVDSFGTVILTASKETRWQITSIQFNPGKLLYGHNGRIINHEEFLLALSILIHLVKPLLANPEDWRHIVPGLSDRPRAWWHSIEIPFHTTDEDGRILSAFSKGRHPEITRSRGYDFVRESVAFCNSTGNLCVAIYRKDLHMKRTRVKFLNPDMPPVLRIEVRLKDDKLRQYLPDATWRTIDGQPRLVCFRPEDVKKSHLDVAGKFAGIFRTKPLAKRTGDKIGRMMGMVAARSEITIAELLDFYKSSFFTKASTGSARNTLCRLRKAAEQELALYSPVTFSDLFSDDAWHSQPMATAPRLEAMVQARHRHIGPHPIVAATYGSKPEPQLRS